jgi:hypothetical protein
VSHFSVLVIGPDVEAQLQPYHEFECTGTDDQYVQNVDITEKAREEFSESTTLRMADPSGKLFDAYEDRFYFDPTPEEMKILGPIAGSGSGSGLSWTSKDWGDGLGYRAKIHKIPVGWKEVKIPVSEVETFAEWVEGWYGVEPLQEGFFPDLLSKHKYGWCRVNEGGEVIEVIDRTNQNAHWDWYVVGGRWAGKLTLKGGIKADQSKKGGVDWERMKNEAGKEAGERWDAAHAVIAGRSVEPWKSFMSKVDDKSITLEAARKDYNAQDVVKDMRENEGTRWFNVEKFLVSREEYVQSNRSAAIATFAVVKDGTWYERGRMGWWGCVSDEKDQDEWNQQFADLLDGLPYDTMLTVVDCHI